MGIQIINLIKQLKLLIMENKTIKFSHIQNDAIERGKIKREWFLKLIKSSIDSKTSELYNNLYIYSPAGLGKTFSVSSFLKESNVKHVLITGNTSCFAFGIQLATLQYLNQNLEEIVVHVDDCDALFATDASCNAMKKVLDQAKQFVYEKSMANTINGLNDLQRNAIEHFKEEGKMGFCVPTHNLKFIFTSNIQLPFDDEVNIARKTSKYKAIILAHQNAIRSRCKVGDFDLNMEEHWGWLADVTLSNEFIKSEDFKIESKIEILNFIWHNWNYLKERSIRLIEKMAITKTQFEDSYQQIWELDNLKSR